MLRMYVHTRSASRWCNSLADSVRTAGRASRAGLAVTVPLVFLVACGTSDQADAPAATSPSSKSSPPTSSTLTQPDSVATIASPSTPATSSPTTSTTISTTTPVLERPLEVVEGRFLGIGHGSRISDAERVLGVAAVVEHADQMYTQSNSTIQVPACLTPPGDHWAIYSGGLNLFFEGSSRETAAITNWNYTGGPAAGFTEMVDASGLTIGDTRQEIEAAYPSSTDYIDEVFVPGMRLGLDGESIVWLGDVDCALETEIDEGGSVPST